MADGDEEYAGLIVRGRMDLGSITSCGANLEAVSAHVHGRRLKFLVVMVDCVMREREREGDGGREGSLVKAFLCIS